jgi:hypothetical protein
MASWLARAVQTGRRVKTMTTLWSGVVTLGAAGCLAVQACGGSTAGMAPLDGSTDGADLGGDAAPDTTMPTPEAAPDAPVDAAAPMDTSSPVDAGPPCAPPVDPTKAALCITFTHEALSFVASDPSLDGRGLLAVDVHDTANPDSPEGGSLPALTGAVFPPADGGDGGELDLSAPLPTVRFDGLPATVVYPRGIFLDSRSTQKVGAGWWLGGYDLTGGLRTPALLQPVTLRAGVASTVTINLTALRALAVTLTRSATPVGNAQGPATVIVTPGPTPTDASAFFGIAQAPCANLAAADAAVAANGFVFGPGPYYSVGVLDDFGADASPGLGPGALTSLSYVDGSLTSPPSAQLQYAAGAYVVQQTLDLDLVIPLADAGVDPVSCP